MNFHTLVNWIGGDEKYPEIQRIFNIACSIGFIFCSLSAIECALASLSPILVAGNLIYACVLAVGFYLSRFRNKFRLGRGLGVLMLVFVYTPFLWIFNGGSVSGIPYFILLFSSFITVITVGKDQGKGKKHISTIVIVTLCLVMVGLILFEYHFPDRLYQFEDQSVRYMDMVIGMLFAITSNYFIIRAFIREYYKQLDKVKEYSTRLEELVVRDSMTCLYHHAYIIGRLTEEINKCSRYHLPLSVLMIDIDHFKQVNDTYGHPFGDEVLINIANLLRLTCRSTDMVARYGGEEFLIIMPGTNSESGVILADRILRAIQNLKFSQQITITISGGITEYKYGDTTTTTINRVDSLLYRAKREGRNRIKRG